MSYMLEKDLGHNGRHWIALEGVADTVTGASQVTQELLSRTHENT